MVKVQFFSKIKDWIYGVVFSIMVLYGMFVTALKGEVEEDENN